jgi:TonB-dependent starch-binding outer membrane protein SusC
MFMKKLYVRLSMTAVLLLMLASVVLAQERTVSGTVNDDTGSPIPGVNVLLKGTTTGTSTDADGKYSLGVSGSDAVLVFSFIGFTTQEVPVGTRTLVDVSLAADVQTLTELVVTGYGTEKKADIIGAVAVVNNKDLMATASPNFSQQLQGRAPGVVASGAGAPGEGAKIRVRGFTSFGNSEPLYIIDGVPTGDPSRVNPNDIESIQVLKDATSASIYGARAAQGVIIITTKQGKAGTMQVTYDGYTGVSYIPSSIQPELINTAEYGQYLKKTIPTGTHPLFGNIADLDPNNYPTAYVVSNNLKSGMDINDPRADPSLYSIEDYGNMYQINHTSPGTNWFDAISRNAPISNHQLGASGGTEKNTYSVGLNYFKQDGIYLNSGYERYAVRVNTQFKPTSFFTFGENLQVISESFQNAQGNGARGEASAWAQAFRMVPYVPVNDIGGGWGGNGIGQSGNGTNPVAQLHRDKDDKRINFKMLGNVFGEVNLFKDLAFRTSFGVEYGNFYSKDNVMKTYERAENTGTTSLNMSYNYNLAWTFSNTLTYNKAFGDHKTKVLLGTEAVKANIGDGINTTNVNTFDFEDPDFISLNTDQATGAGLNSNRGIIRTLSSVFGRIDYSFKDKYLINATVRRDGSSVFGSENRYGTFPAFGVGWRISEEGFMQGVDFISDLKFRGGWGQMGSERNVNAVNQYTTFRSNAGLSNYDISRSQNSLAVGYTAYNASSQATKWETSESTNIGFDAQLFGGKTDFSFSWFNTDTKDLLTDRQPSPFSAILVQPAINIGKMRNRGIEFGWTQHMNITGDLKFDATLTFTHYKNEAVDIDGNPETFIARNASRLNNVWRTQAGHPVSSFYGFELDGFFNTQADLDALEQTDEKIGSWRFKDRTGDGKITDDDRTFIGNPQPDFIMGINLAFTYKNFDLSTFIMWNQGNELYNYTKYWTDMQVFIGGVSKRVLYEGWTPETQSGTLPQLGNGASDGYTATIRSASMDYYIEDGSFLRGRTFQLGYTIPTDVAAKVKLTRARVYFQAQNYFTVTNYSGPDPDISIQSNANAQNTDLQMGLDDSAFPNPRQVLVGVNLAF